MANPQKENGYTAIANEILERLVNTALLGSEFQVALFVIRKTYGYQKKSDIISLTQFEKGTGLSRPTVVKTIKNLMSRKILVKIYLPHKRISFSFNKDYENWVVNTSKLVKGKWLNSKDVLTETSKDVLTHKRKKEKDDKIKAEQSSAISETIKLFEGVNPNCKTMYGNTTQRKAVSYLLEEYGFDMMTKVIALLPKTNTIAYLPTITTPVQLKDKWASLEAGLRKEKSKITNNSQGIA